MRAILPVLLLCLALRAHAREWKNEVFHCAANVPDSAGWQNIDAPIAPGIAPVLTMQNAAKQAVFGINVIEKYRGADLASPAVQSGLEAMLREFGYQFVGHSLVNSGGLVWLQYPVRSVVGQQQVSGLIRYASVGGIVFSISMLRGGGQEAAQDSELQQAAASFHVIPPTAVVQTASPERPKEIVAKPKSSAEAPDEEDHSQARMIWAGGAALVVLLIFISIIGQRSRP